MTTALLIVVIVLVLLLAVLLLRTRARPIPTGPATDPRRHAAPSLPPTPAHGAGRGPSDAGAPVLTGRVAPPARA